MADADLSLYLSVPIAQPQPPEFQKLLFPQQHLLWLHFQVTVYLAYENKGGHIIRGLQEEIQREAQRAVLLCIPFCISQFRLVVQSRTKLWLRPRVLWNNRLESDPSFKKTLKELLMVQDDFMEWTYWSLFKLSNLALAYTMSLFFKSIRKSCESCLLQWLMIVTPSFSVMTSPAFIAGEEININKQHQQGKKLI